MKPVDIRNEVWADILGRLDGDRLKVYEELRAAGACTTRELARRMEWDLNNVAPRVTELGQIGLCVCVGRRGKSGVYEAVHREEARVAFEAAQRGGTEQMLMGV